MSSKWGWAVLLAASLVLVGGVWRAGIDTDEQIQLHALMRQPILERATAPFELYDFSHVGEDEAADLRRGRDLVYRGAVKWCQAPFPLHVAFFRPVSSALLTLEFRAFGFHFRLYHLFQIALALAATAAFVRLWTRVLRALDHRPPSAPLLVGLLVLNPINQELLTRICTLHYLLAALAGFGAYLAILDERLAPARRTFVVLALGALGMLASEASIPVHVLGSCALVALWQHLTRRQRWAWALLLGQLAVYLVWYRTSGYGAVGWGYGGSTDAQLPSSVWPLIDRGLDGALDVFAAAVLTDVHHWMGFLATVGTSAGQRAILVSAVFVIATGLYLASRPAARRWAVPLLLGVAMAAIPVAAVGQPKLRVLAIPSLGMGLLLVMMARDAWEGLRRRTPGGEAPPRLARLALVTVFGYATVRMTATVALTPVAMTKLSLPSGVIAARWLGGLRLSPADVAPVGPGEPHAADDEVNVLIASGVTGVPYPFGPALLTRNGLAPDVGRWLFLSDLPPGHVLVTRIDDRTYRVALTIQAARFHVAHGGLYPLAQRCFAGVGSEFATRFATFVVHIAANSEPLDATMTLRPGTTARFWTADRGKLTQVTPPAIGARALF